MDENKKPAFKSFEEYQHWLSGINGENNPSPNGEGNNLLSDARIKTFVSGILDDSRIKRLMLQSLLDNNYYSNPSMLEAYLARSLRNGI